MSLAEGHFVSETYNCFCVKFSRKKKNSLTVPFLPTSTGHYSSSSYDDAKVYSGIWFYSHVVQPGCVHGCACRTRGSFILVLPIWFLLRVFPRDLALSNWSAHWRGPFNAASSALGFQHTLTVPDFVCKS